MSRGTGWRVGGVTRRTVVVIAGNRQEFEAFCREKRHVAANTVHANSPDAVRGLDYVQVYKTGSWYLMDRGVLRQIVETLRTKNQVGIAESEVY